MSPSAARRTLLAAVLLAGWTAIALADAQRQGDRPPGTHQDNTPGHEWIARLDRPDRLPGLRIDSVIAALELRPDTIIADIGAGTGAYTIPFARAVTPGGAAIAVDIWPELLEYIEGKAARTGTTGLRTVLAAPDDPHLAPGSIDIAFFHDVFHNVNDRPGYLRRLALALRPGGRIAIIEQEFDDPIARRWDRPEDRITREQVRDWMSGAGFDFVRELDLFQGPHNPTGAGMPERWFVIYQRSSRLAATPR